jgi:hypothetical protein
MTQHIAGPIIKYNDSFFDWLWPHMLMIDGYAYAGLDFRGYLDLALLEDAQWGDLGNKYTFCSFKCFCNFLSYKMFLCLSKN